MLILILRSVGVEENIFLCTTSRLLPSTRLHHVFAIMGEAAGFALYNWELQQLHPDGLFTAVLLQ